MEKHCLGCGKMFSKKQTCSLKQWEEREKFCSRVCSDSAKRGNPNFTTKTHGMTHTKFWEVWKGMKQRCGNPNKKSYKNYGGRGIQVGEKWKNFENFMNDMYEGYKKALTQYGRPSIERIDVNGNYCKENCKWIPIQEQSRNRRNTNKNKIKVIFLLEQGDNLRFSSLIRRLRKRYNIISLI